MYDRTHHHVSLCLENLISQEWKENLANPNNDCGFQLEKELLSM